MCGGGYGRRGAAAMPSCAHNSVKVRSGGGKCSLVMLIIKVHLQVFSPPADDADGDVKRASNGDGCWQAHRFLPLQHIT